MVLKGFPSKLLIVASATYYGPQWRVNDCCHNKTSGERDKGYTYIPDTLVSFLLPLCNPSASRAALSASWVLPFWLYGLVSTAAAAASIDTLEDSFGLDLSGFRLATFHIRDCLGPWSSEWSSNRLLINMETRPRTVRKLGYIKRNNE